jgi:hypothetical protein
MIIEENLMDFLKFNKINFLQQQYLLIAFTTFFDLFYALLSNLD